VRHVYCDESGGTDPASPCFLVTAVATDPRKAGHLIGRLRKRTGLKGEAHGHALDARRRDLFLRYFGDMEDTAAIVVVLKRGAGLAGTLAEAGREAVLRTHMMAEAIALVLDTGKSSRGPATVGITIDGGRYKRSVLERERSRLVELLAVAEPPAKVEAQYDNSERTAGLQVADIIGNTALRSLGGYASADEQGRLIALEREGLLQVRDAVLPALRAARQDPENGKAAP
jgi:hypothetical protein